MSEEYRRSRTRTALCAGVAMAAMGWAQSAQAQLNPAVDVCSGLSIDRSAVTEIVGAVNEPIVGSVQDVVNGLIDVTAILPGVTLLAPLDIDLEGILAAVAAGDPIAVQVLDENGNIISPSDGCTVTVDALTLDTEGGIALGGNGLTGLGAEDRLASAGTIDAIAIGNDAETSVSAGAAVALGDGALATGLDSVALGAGSVADRDGTVSIGTAGAERQLVNVAAGSLATDATNLGQVQGLIADAGALSVFYDDVTLGTVTFAGPTGTVLANVAPGEVSPTSSQAVNGSQLFETNRLVAENGLAIADLGGRLDAVESGAFDDTAINARIDAVASDVAGNTAAIAANTTAIGVNSNAIAENSAAIARNEASIVDLDGRVSGLAGDVDALDGRVGDAEGAIAVLDGRIDGVEGRVGDLEAGLAGTGEAIAGLDGRITGNSEAIAGLDGRVTINSEAIAGLDDRVTANGDAIAGLDTRVGANTDAIAGLDVRVSGNAEAIDGLDDRVTGAETSIGIVQGDIADLDVRVSGNSQAIDAIRGQVANVPIAYRSDADADVPSAVPTNTTALIGADASSPVRLTNLAQGDLSAGSTDAVNGSQLAATNDRVSSAEGAITANGVRIEANAAGIAGNSVAIAANRSDIDANTVAIADNRSDIDANRAEIVRIGSNLAGSTVVAVQYSDPDAPTISNGGTMTNDVTLIGADPSAPVALHNVADGRSATDAVNLRQLQGGLAEAMAGSMAYTDARLVEYDARLVAMSFDLEDVRRSSYAGTAGVAALANLPQPMDAGRSMVSGGVGHHRGETAFALGFSSAVGEDFVVKAGASVDTRGNGTFGAGAGFQF